MSDGTPLPNALSGVIVQRLIEIDEALLYLISGAMSGMLLKEPLEQTGALTPETAQNALSVMLETYFNQRPQMPVIASYLMCAAEIAPDGYLVCDGSAVSRTTYVDLFNVIMTNYGAGNGTTTFNLPDFRDLSPMGSPGTVVGQPGAVQGELEVTLNTAQIPSHNHSLVDAGHNHQGSNAGSFLMNGGTGTKNHQPFAGSVGRAEPNTSTNTTGITMNNTGGGGAHNNLHPVMGVQMLIYSGVLE